MDSRGRKSGAKRPRQPPPPPAVVMKVDRSELPAWAARLLHHCEARELHRMERKRYGVASTTPSMVRGVCAFSKDEDGNVVPHEDFPVRATIDKNGNILDIFDAKVGTIEMAIEVPSHASLPTSVPTSSRASASAGADSLTMSKDLVPNIPPRGDIYCRKEWPTHLKKSTYQLRRAVSAAVARKDFRCIWYMCSHAPRVEYNYGLQLCLWMSQRFHLPVYALHVHFASQVAPTCATKARAEAFSEFSDTIREMYGIPLVRICAYKNEYEQLKDDLVVFASSLSPFAIVSDEPEGHVVSEGFLRSLASADAFQPSTFYLVNSNAVMPSRWFRGREFSGRKFSRREFESKCHGFHGRRVTHVAVLPDMHLPATSIQKHAWISRTIGGVPKVPVLPYSSVHYAAKLSRPPVSKSRERAKAKACTALENLKKLKDARLQLQLLSMQLKLGALCWQQLLLIGNEKSFAKGRLLFLWRHCCVQPSYRKYVASRLVCTPLALTLSERIDLFWDTPDCATIRAYAERCSSDKSQLPCYLPLTFEMGKTDDVKWNNIQQKLVATGLLHSDFKKYWCDVILTRNSFSSPREALGLIFDLIDKYEVGGSNDESIGEIFAILNTNVD